MRYLLTSLLCALTLSLTAQEPLTYPYNPDEDVNGLIASPDLLGLLAMYGDEFSPAEIMIGDTTLSNWIQILNQTLANQQAVIDSLQASLDSQETQLDSTMIADMIAAAGGLGSGGGCDFDYPDGLDGDPVIFDGAGGYTVPEGKNLYMYHGYNQTQSGVLEINGNKAVRIGNGNHFQHSSRGVPLIAKGGDVIGLQGVSPSDTVSNSPTYIHALLVDPNITPINFDVHQNSYIVNQGERLYIYLAFSEDGYSSEDYNHPILEINGNPCSPIISSSFHNSMQGLPLIAMPGDVISASNTSAYAQVFGYLADEDYFADCGGGGSSEGGSGGGELGPCQGELTVNYHGYDYQLVEIGDQCWYKENLRTDLYRDGQLLSQGNSAIIGLNPEWDELNEVPPFIEGDLGYFYSYGVITSASQLCPQDWHIPESNDWIELAATIDLSLGGHFLKDSVNWNGTDKYGFNALPTGSAYVNTYNPSWDWEYECNCTSYQDAVEQVFGGFDYSSSLQGDGNESSWWIRLDVGTEVESEGWYSDYPMVPSSIIVLTDGTAINGLLTGINSPVSSLHSVRCIKD